MKLWVVRLSENEPVVWGEINEAVVRAETKEQAVELFFDSWGDLDSWNGDPHEWVRIAELRSDGPAGIVSGTTRN